MQQPYDHDHGGRPNIQELLEFLPFVREYTQTIRPYFSISFKLQDHSLMLIWILTLSELEFKHTFYYYDCNLLFWQYCSHIVAENLTLQAKIKQGNAG